MGRFSLSEPLGNRVGQALRPWTAAVARARKSRVFHPRGTALEASVRVAADGSVASALATYAPRQALLRFSSALWKEREWPDVLGLAVRWGDQDLLFATIYAPALTLLGPLHTRFRDFRRNAYYAVSPFELPDGTRGYLRVRLWGAASVAKDDGTRRERLIGSLPSTWRLEASAGRWGPWEAVADFTAERESPVDQEALRFSPFNAGLGFRPRGFVHSIRPGAYAGSQNARPRSEQERNGPGFSLGASEQKPLPP